MKCIDINTLQSRQKKKIKEHIPGNSGTKSEHDRSASVIPFHEMLKNELKLYRGESKSARLGVLRKYDELIAMARQK